MNAPQQMPATGDNPKIPFTPRPVAHIKLRTGFAGATIHVSESDRPLFEALRDSLFCSVRPKTGMEDEFFRHLLNAAWQLRRLAQWEDELLSQPVNPFLDPESEARLRRFRKYKASLEHSLKEALAELRKLQTERLAQDCPPLHFCIPQSNTLGRTAHTCVRPPAKVHQMQHPARAAAS